MEKGRLSPGRMADVIFRGAKPSKVHKSVVPTVLFQRCRAKNVSFKSVAPKLSCPPCDAVPCNNVIRRVCHPKSVFKRRRVKRVTPKSVLKCVRPTQPSLQECCFKSVKRFVLQELQTCSKISKLKGRVKSVIKLLFLTQTLTMKTCQHWGGLHLVL